MSPLPHRERVLQALRGEPRGEIPCGEFFISDEFCRAFSPPVATPEPVPPTWSVVQALDLDVVSVPLSAGWGALEQPNEDRALASLLQWHAAGDRFVVALVDGPFSAAAKSAGLNALLHHIGGAPHIARELFRRGAEETRVTAAAVRDAGADGVVLGEDIAYNRSTFVSPAQLHELYFPELQQAVAQLRALGLVTFFHSDGNLNALLDDLAACGLDGLQGLEPEAGMAIGAVRAWVGARLTLWGNLGFDFLSRPRSDEEIDAALRALVSANAQPGRLIVGSCSGLVQGVDVETARRVYDRFHRVHSH